MKSFQNFAVNIEEKRTTPGFGSPSGYDPQGEAKYTKRPGPKEPGRRATVQKSPKTVTQVKGEIEAAKGFGGARSGGLDTRTVPSFVTDKRQARAAAAGTPDPWSSAGRRLGNPMRARGGSQALADFIDDFAKTTKISKSAALRQTLQIPDSEATFKRIFGQALKTQKRSQLRNPSVAKQLGLFGSDQPLTPKSKNLPALEPKKPSVPVAPGQLDISDIKKPEPPKKPPVIKQSEVSKKAASYRETQKPAAPTQSPPKSTSSPKTSVLDIKATEVKGTKFAEPAPKVLKGLSAEPAGKLVPVRSGQSQTIRPQQGPGRTGILGKPKAGQMVGARIEPVRVADITKPSPKVNVDITPKQPKVSTPAALKSTQPQKLADIVVKASKQVRSDIAAERSAERAKMMKGLGTAGKVLGVVGTGIEAKKGYDIAKAMGGSEKRSLGAGAARGLGSGLGGVVGGALGSVAGPIGSAVGATAGLTVGAELGSKAYDVITGDPKKKVTTQGVLSNIRKAVPQEVRSQVPEPVRRRFTDFVKTAGRTYGVWQKSQQSGNK